MTLRLILIRHAKSSWDDPTQDDHDRVLNTRGRHAAPAIGGWLAMRGYEAEQVLCSTAARTRETLDRLAIGAAALPVRYERRLYHATSDRMLGLLHTAEAESVLMIGHNPGIADFARRLLRTAPHHTGFATYPTCATLVADFDAARWDDVQFGTGRAVDFIVPRDLD